MKSQEPRGRRPTALSAGRVGLYVFLFFAALFFAAPLYVILATSFKSLDEIRNGTILMLPTAPTLKAWSVAWSSACTGMTCRGLSPGFANSILIVVPSVAISVVLGAINGYALAFWRVRWAGALFAGLVIGGFLPVQIFIYPLVRMASVVGVSGSLWAVILTHVIFSMPIATLVFRNYFGGLPIDLFKAARIDGAGFFRTFAFVIMPMSVPIVVVIVILLVTSIWNDFILGLVFAGRANQPMTVQLNNIVGSDTGVHEYNVEMAAVILTTLVPLIVYFVSGRWFIRGIAAGAVKG